MNQYHGEKNIIFDTVLADLQGFLRKAKSKIESGKVKVHAIYTDIETAKGYNIKRDRTVPLNLLIEKHKGFRNAMSELLDSKEYKDGKISIEVRANDGVKMRDIPSKQIAQFIGRNRN